MIRRPPRSTLFPYTRSSDLWYCAQSVLNRGRAAPGSDVLSPGKAPIVKRSNPTREDRKSTRLNSSHITISYAVFCLKKKIHSHPTYTHQQNTTHYHTHTTPP